MAATAGSLYQIIALAHQAGRPPNTEYQRSNETYEQYIARMKGNELLPDINPTEEDSDYLIRLATYVPAPALVNISASYAIYAGTEIAPEASSSYANKASLADLATTATSASHALRANLANALPLGTYAVTSSWATNAVNSAPSDTASYLSGGNAVLGGITSTNLTITNTAGNCIDARASTTGYGIYAQGLQTEAVSAVQTGVPSGAINRGAISATRAIANLNGQVVNVATFTVLDQYGLGDAPLISATNIATEVFQVDRTGSLSCSGSKGFTGNIVTPCTLSLQGGIVTGWTA